MSDDDLSGVIKALRIPYGITSTTSSTVSSGSLLNIGRSIDIPSIPAQFSIPCCELTDPRKIILKYEIDMYLQSLFLLGTLIPIDVIRYAVIECAVIHARNLCDFFCFNTKRGYLRLSQLVPESVKEEPYLTLIANLKRSDRGEKNGVQPINAFNEFVAHMTEKRLQHARGYDYVRELSSIQNDLTALIIQVKPLFMTP